MNRTLFPPPRDWMPSGGILPVRQRRFSIHADRREWRSLIPWPIAEDGPLLRVREDHGLKAEDYAITIGEYVEIRCRTRRGLRYAVQTLEQLFSEAGDGYILPKGELLDSPSFSLRGVIEGFYGRPWSRDERLDMIDFCARHRLNTFFYAPKDDPYHRAQWKTPYPEEESARLFELVDHCREQDVDFVFSVSPGMSIRFASDEDLDALVGKFAVVLSRGVRSAALLLDDIEPELKDPVDLAAYGRDFGRAQAELCNRAYERLAERFGDLHFVMCPTEYSGDGDSPYKQSMRTYLRPEINVIWTGKGVCSAVVRAADADRTAELYGHDLILWDNYPVNDGDPWNIKLGSLRGRATDLPAHRHRGVVMNPMNQARASMLPLATAADYLWNAPAYDPDGSLKNAIRRASELPEYVWRTLVDGFSRSNLWERDAPELEAALSAAKPGDYGLARAHFESYRVLPDAIMAGADPRLAEELKPWFDRMRATGELGVLACDLLEQDYANVAGGDDGGAKGKVAQAETLLAGLAADQKHAFAGPHALALAAKALANRLSTPELLATITMRSVDLGEPNQDENSFAPPSNVMVAWPRGWTEAQLEDALARLRQSFGNRPDVRMPLVAAVRPGGERDGFSDGLASMPAPQVQGITGKTGCAFNAACVQGEILRDLGVQVNVGLRLQAGKGEIYYSTEPDAARRFARAAMNGYRFSHVLWTAGPFPFAPQAEAVLDETDAVKTAMDDFRTAIEQGTPIIELGQEPLPRVAGISGAEVGIWPRHSRTVIEDWLRDRLSFDGVVLSQVTGDSLDAANALHAGVDWLWVTAGAENFERVRTGLSILIDGEDGLRERAREAAARVILLRTKVKDAKRQPDKRDFYRDLRQEVVERAMVASGLTVEWISRIARGVVVKGDPSYVHALADALVDRGVAAGAEAKHEHPVAVYVGANVEAVGVDPDLWICIGGSDPALRWNGPYLWLACDDSPPLRAAAAVLAGDREAPIIREKNEMIHQK